MKFASIAAISLWLITLGAHQSFAQVYGNPVPFLKDTQLAAGLLNGTFVRKLKSSSGGRTVADDTAIARTVIRVAYGLEDDLGFDGYLGTASFEGTRGTEFGAGVRQGLGVLGEELQTAVTAAVFTGSISKGTSSGSYTQLDVSYGGATEIDDGFLAYAAVLLSKLDVSVKTDFAGGSATTTSEGDSLIGVYGGAEYAPAEKRYRIGAELHLIHETGFGIYGFMRF